MAFKYVKTPRRHQQKLRRIAVRPRWPAAARVGVTLGRMKDLREFLGADERRWLVTVQWRGGGGAAAEGAK